MAKIIHMYVAVFFSREIYSDTLGIISIFSGLVTSMNYDGFTQSRSFSNYRRKLKCLQVRLWRALLDSEVMSDSRQAGFFVCRDVYTG